MSLIERPHHDILYAVGKSKLANVVLIPCKLLGDQVRFARDRRSIGRQGRCLDRSDLAESGRMSGRAFSNGRCGLSRNCTNKSGRSRSYTSCSGQSIAC